MAGAYQGGLSPADPAFGLKTSGALPQVRPSVAAMRREIRSVLDEELAGQEKYKTDEATNWTSVIRVHGHRAFPYATWQSRPTVPVKTLPTKLGKD